MIKSSDKSDMFQASESRNRCERRRFEPPNEAAVSVGQAQEGTAELILFDTAASQPSFRGLAEAPVLLYGRQEGKSFYPGLLFL